MEDLNVAIFPSNSELCIIYYVNFSYKRNNVFTSLYLPTLNDALNVMSILKYFFSLWGGYNDGEIFDNQIGNILCTIDKNNGYLYSNNIKINIERFIINSTIIRAECYIDPKHFSQYTYSKHLLNVLRVIKIKPRLKQKRFFCDTYIEVDEDVLYKNDMVIDA